MFSLKTIKRFLNKNKNIKNYKFRKIIFPQTLTVKKDLKNHVRSWTENIRHEKFFINGLNVIQHQYFLIINLK